MNKHIFVILTQFFSIIKMSTKSLLDIKSKYRDSTLPMKVLDSTPGQGTRPHMTQLKIPHAATEEKNKSAHCKVNVKREKKQE